LFSRRAIFALIPVTLVVIEELQEIRAIARKPRDAAVRVGVMLADIHYKFKSSQAPKARL